ncbi:hypothetical protein H2200_007791 [Cladophialophora chaetospira]|uniref:Uncharacterized protein n=1 Tax=Cladophialophora chaetospira TaxID=386627 RepID=A0AA38X6K0_9EURO|nr:hypothetical protein H2200_007791 [Cladophialophora chaetospira]
MTSTKRQSAPSVHQFPSPALSTTGSSSTSSTEAGECFEPESLTSTLDQLQPDFKAVIQAARDFLEDSHIAPAFAQGWFQPENNYQRRLDSELTGLSLNDIATAFFYKDLSQALYGDRDIRPRRKPQTAAAILEDSDDLEKLEKRKAIHQKQEEDRRNRHRELQRNSHARCPEVAAKCGAEHARREKDTTRAQAGKGPGKDEQLYSSIYTQEMAGKVVQALDERRLRAEDMVRNLLQALQQVCNSFPDTWEPHQDGREAVRGNSQSRPSYVGMKRPRDNAEEEQELAWKVLVRGSEQKPGRA